MTYGLPKGTNITYGAPGFPQWVYDLASVFNLKASTYPGHQESHRVEAGFAPNPQGQNRGIDWSGSVADMQRFADYLLSVRRGLEQVIWENPHTRRRAGVAGGDDVSTTAYYHSDYAGHQDHVHTRQSIPIPLPKGVTVIQRPDFNEYPVWSNNYQPRGGIKPTMFLLHTQEGSGNADQLARWLGGNVEASYHYTISMDPRDKGVTVCDVVDTDYASWSVLDYNNRSINLCFAGSRAAWSRQEWIDNVGRAIDVAAYLAVQDCRKYGFSTAVVPPPYNGTPGISDHAYVTSRGIGTHTDIGKGFPWDLFAESVAIYSGTVKPPAPTPPTPPAPPKPVPQYPRDWTDRQLMEAIWSKVQNLRPSQ